MIPKVVHYCWFGHNPLPELAQRCIASWKKYLPDYEIKEWNEENFDVNIIPYTAEAYACKKYAFVSDYARFYILYKYGGLYFDTDVEVLRPLDDILRKGPFMGCENDPGTNPNETIGVNPGLGLGVNPGFGLYKQILDYYKSIHFIKSNGEIDSDTVVSKTTRILVAEGLKNSSEVQYVAGVYIYPKVYFCPGEKERSTRVYNPLTYSAHHYTASWRDPKFNAKLKNPFWRVIFKFQTAIVKVIRLSMGEDRWISFRDRHLTTLHNFFRGIK